MGDANALIPIELIERRIYLIRGQKVMMDRDLAEIYGVSTKRLNEQVRRNRRRFPEDFLFRLTAIEAKKLASLRSQFATLKKSRGSHRKYHPLVFTEHGAVMLASVLNSTTAVTASIHVVRAFVRLRQMAADHKHLADKFKDLERMVREQGENICNLFDAIEGLHAPPDLPRRRIGFKPKSE